MQSANCVVKLRKEEIQIVPVKMSHETEMEESLERSFGQQLGMAPLDKYDLS